MTTRHHQVIETALHGEVYSKNERKDGFTYQTRGRGRVTLRHSGRVNVTGDLADKVLGMGGEPYRHGLTWHE